MKKDRLIATILLVIGAAVGLAAIYQAVANGGLVWPQ